MELTATYVELLFPGSFYPEESVEMVNARNPKAIARKHKGAFAFQFYDLTTKEVEVDGVKRTVSGKRKNVSPKYYPGGKVYDKQAIERLGPEFRILRSNMNNDGWGIVVKTRCGNWQPFEDKDEIL